MTTQNPNLLLEKMRAFRIEHLDPLEPELLRQDVDAILPRLMDLRAKARELNLWGPQLPHALGGQGFTLSQTQPISEELGRSPLGHFVCNMNAPDVSNMALLIAHATPAQREKFLLPVARGELRSCFAMTEPDTPGSNPTMQSTTARREGDDYIINGRKWFITGADGAAFAIVLATTNPGAEKLHRRSSLFIVPFSAPGFRHVRRIKMMGEEGGNWLAHSELELVEVRVPAENLIGEEGRGFAMAQERLGPARLHHCMRWLGNMQRALDLTCQRAATREIAPGIKLAHKQAVQHMIADSCIDIECARHLIQQTCQAVEAKGYKDARVEMSLMKAFVPQSLGRVLDRAIQVHGALGVSDLTPLAFWLRHERCSRLYDGPDEVHKSLVAREMLKGYGVDVNI
jgi:alkylation response protein AidB-like acyl-CoA dehydrogenase